MTIGFAIGLIAAYWVYTDANSRGQDTSTVLLWSLGTVFIPVIILPLYLIIGRNRNIRKRPHNDDIIDVDATVVMEETRTCPVCAGKVEPDFKLCPYCGYTLKLKCANCGREIDRDWKTCPYCQTLTSK